MGTSFDLSVDKFGLVSFYGEPNQLHRKKLGDLFKWPDFSAPKRKIVNVRLEPAFVGNLRKQRYHLLCRLTTKPYWKGQRTQRKKVRRKNIVSVFFLN